MQLTSILCFLKVEINATEKFDHGRQIEGKNIPRLFVFFYWKSE